VAEVNKTKIKKNWNWEVLTQIEEEEGLVMFYSVQLLGRKGKFAIAWCVHLLSLLLKKKRKKGKKNRKFLRGFSE
jgi:hypothetical protein